MALVAPEAEAMTSASRQKADDTPVPKTNILMIRKDGEAIDPATGQLLDPPGKYVEYDKYISNIFSGIKEFCADKKPPCKILFYFHGGLNGQEDSVARATDLTDTIKSEDVYSIFVTWESSLVFTCWLHIA